MFIIVALGAYSVRGPARLSVNRVTPDDRYGRLPLTFVENRGQAGESVQYLAAGRGYSLLLGADEARLLMRRPARDQAKVSPEPSAFRMKLVNSDPAVAGRGQDRLTGKVNYLLGNDPAKWHRNIPTYSRVRYESVYPGIDLVYYGNQRQLEYDFIISPAADPAAINLRFEGAEQVRLDQQGDLLLGMGDGEVRFRRPVAYQGSAETKQFVTASYQLGSDHQVSFHLGAYDRTRPLVVDPVLIYSTFIGGSSFDVGNGIAADSAGNAYVIGLSLSSDYPVTPGAFSSAAPGIVISKLSPDGSTLVYSTFLGGTALGFRDEGFGIAVDPSGQAIVTGITASRDFPTTANAFDRTCGTDGTCNQQVNINNSDAFLTVLNSNGSDLVYSTFLGGSDIDSGAAVAVDPAGKIYLTGYSFSTELPASGSAQPTCHKGTFAPCEDGFVAKFDTTLSGTASLVYATYLGGNGDDFAQAITADQAGNAYVTGQTISRDFPTTSSAFDKTCGDTGRCEDINSVSAGPDVFVTKIDPAGTTFLYSTYLGGNGWDIGSGIAVDSRGDAYVTGLTQSTDFPVSRKAFGPRLRGIEDAFVTIMNPTGSRPLASTYLGGDNEDKASAIKIDRSGNAYVAGTTFSDDFPTTPDRAFGFSGSHDAFVTKIDRNLQILVHSTYIGGSEDDLGLGVALGGNFTFITGSTHSPNFPVTAGAFDTTCGSDGLCNDDLDDIFVAKFQLPQTAILYAEANLSNDFLIFPSQKVGETSPPQNVILANVGDSPLLISSIAAAGDFAQTNICPPSLPPGSRCRISVTFTPTQPGARLGTVTIADNAADSPQVINLNGSGISNAKAELSPGDIDFGNQKVGTESPPRTETITSVGTSDLIISSVFVGEPFFQTNDCVGHPIHPGESCTVNITFKPNAPGGYFTIFQISDNTSDFNAANITGTGVP